MTLPFYFSLDVSITSGGGGDDDGTYTITINILPGIWPCEEEFIGSHSDDRTVLLSQAVVVRMLFSVG